MRKTFLDNLNKNIESTAAEKMAGYYEVLLKTNSMINLTTVTTPAEAAEKHFNDSIEAAQYIPPKAHVLDVGTGGGFPGIPLKILRPDIKMTVMDSVGKKTEAVRKMCAECAIDVSVVCARAEESGAGEMRGQFDAVLSRAVAGLPVLLELCIPMVRLGGVFIAYKNAGAEDTKNMTAAGKLGCVLEKTHKYGDRVLLVFRKTEKTPGEYPRRFAKIKKSPL